VDYYVKYGGSVSNVDNWIESYKQRAAQEERRKALDQGWVQGKAGCTINGCWAHVLFTAHGSKQPSVRCCLQSGDRVIVLLQE
jgi:maltose-binding protein MalE